MKKMKGLLLSAVVFAFFTAVNAQAGEITISVAASMTNLFNDLVATFGTEHADIKIITNYASSGQLAKQIDQGAPADLYVSANPKWMKFLDEKGKILEGTKKVFAYNSLVFTGLPATKAASIADIKNLKKIGIGSPKSVPAGQYAEQAMTKVGIYEDLVKNGQVVMAKDVRQALMYAERGETDGSFVYKTDAMLAEKAKILFEVPQDLYNQVTYPIGLTTLAADKADAKAFYDFVTSPAAHETMTKYGFTLP